MPWHAKIQMPTKKIGMKSGAAQAAPAAPLPTALLQALTCLRGTVGKQSIQTCTCKPGGNKFFRGGPYISEKFVPGGTNLKGVQIKRDRTNSHFVTSVLLHVAGSSSIASACSDAAHALRSVREQLQGARKREDNPIDDTRKAAQQEQRVNFAPYSSGSGSKKRKRGRTSLLAQKKTKRHSWSTKFVCLANKNRSKVPCSVDEKEVLVNAGLGERTICIPDVECSSGEFKEILITEFPKLEEAGGFELMRCVPNTRQLEPISATVWRQPKLLKSVVANGRIYIRPIQKNLDLSSIEDADEVYT